MCPLVQPAARYGEVFAVPYWVLHPKAWREKHQSIDLDGYAVIVRSLHDPPEAGVYIGLNCRRTGYVDGGYVIGTEPITSLWLAYQCLQFMPYMKRLRYNELSIPTLDNLPRAILGTLPEPSINFLAKDYGTECGKFIKEAKRLSGEFLPPRDLLRVENPEWCVS